MPWAFIVDGKGCRRRGLSAWRMQALLSAGAAVGAEQAHALGIHRCWQELPPARPQHTPLACIVAGRSCRRRGTRTCRLHPALLAGAAAGEASAHAARMHRCWQERRRRGLNACRLQQILCWQELPEARLRRMPCASVDVGRCCRRRGFIAFRLHAWLLAGAAAGEVLVNAACSHCCWQERPSASNERMPLASIGAGR